MKQPVSVLRLQRIVHATWPNIHLPNRSKQLPYNFSGQKISFTPQSPLDWCEDPKPSWVIALRPQKKHGRGIAHSLIWHGLRVQTFFFTPLVGVCSILRSSHQNLPGILAQPEFCQSMSRFLGLKHLDFIWKLE